MRVNCEGQSASPVRDSWTPSVLLPFCFRYSSLSLFFHNSVPSEGAKLGITGVLKAPPPPDASRSPLPNSPKRLPAHFRGFRDCLLPFRFRSPRVLGAGSLWDFPGPPGCFQEPSPPGLICGPQSVDPSPCFRGPQSAIHVCFRFASVPLPFRFRYAGKLACRVLVRVLWTEGCM